LDIFVAEQLFNVDYVFGFVVFHCAFPVSERVEAYFSSLGLPSLKANCACMKALLRLSFQKQPYGA